MTEPHSHTESELVERVRCADVRAPESLHRQIEELVGERRRRPFVTRRLACAMAAAATAGAIVAALTGGGAPALNLRQASALTLGPATMAAPSESHEHRAQLAAAVDGIPFPYWGGRFGWRSTGARSDRIAGRAVRTVFYADSHGQRIGYAIVAGTSAPRLSGGVVAWRGGVPYRLLVENGSHVVTWLRSGRLCVVSGRDVSSATLLRLASWVQRGGITS
jgi:hypothetical protein